MSELVHGAKLPYDKRPPLEDIHTLLNSKISEPYRNIFVLDIQNDCSCAVEIYDSCSMFVAYLDDGVKTKLFEERVAVPMRPDLSDKDIEELIVAAIKYCAPNNYMDCTPSRLLVSTEESEENIYKAKDKTGATEVIKFSFIEKGTIAVLPDPEFLGCLTVNVGLLGAFCFPHNIYKIEV